MPWSFNKTTPVFIQIVDKLRTDIINGLYKPDDQFPTVRQLASDASVNPNTMQRALSALESEGLLVTRGTIGRFVTSDKEALESAAKTVKAEALAKLVSEARALGITDREIIEYLNNTQGGADQ